MNGSEIKKIHNQRGAFEKTSRCPYGSLWGDPRGAQMRPPRDTRRRRNGILREDHGGCQMGIYVRYMEAPKWESSRRPWKCQNRYLRAKQGGPKYEPLRRPWRLLKESIREKWVPSWDKRRHLSWSLQGDHIGTQTGASRKTPKAPKCAHLPDTLRCPNKSHQENHGGTQTRASERIMEVPNDSPYITILR